ncbi:MAG: single-stranded DNA-specific exonuclease [Thermoplasmata archaeon]
MNKIKKAVGDRDGLLLHHWDTDGMVSAALILKELENHAEFTKFTPSIGNYLLNDEDRKKIEDIDPEFTIVVDMALPEDSINFLKKFGEVFIFDHHLQERHDVVIHHNPIINGESPKSYPSASWVINEYIGDEPSLLSILGAFGDREQKLKENPYAMDTINGVLEKLDARFDEVLRCAYYLDSNYKVGDRKAVTDSPDFLKDVDYPSQILGREDLKENYEDLNKAIEEESSGELEKVKDNVFYREMESPYNIISTVTRKLAWSRDGNIIIVANSEYKEGETQVYIRGPIPDSEKIIQMVKKDGYSAGGKSDVVGMVIPTEEKNRLMDEIKNHL